MEILKTIKVLHKKGDRSEEKIVVSHAGKVVPKFVANRLNDYHCEAQGGTTGEKAVRLQTAAISRRSACCSQHADFRN